MAVIETLTLKAGRTATSHDAQEITLAPCVLIVGPNNAGKSLLLREIHWYLRRERQVEYLSVLGGARLSETLSEAAVASIRRALPFPVGPDLQVEQDRFAVLAAPQPNFEAFLAMCAQHVVRIVEGSSRTELSRVPIDSGGHPSPHSHIRALWRDSDLRRRFQEITFDAFRYRVVFDPAHPTGHITFRITPDAVPDGLEFSLDPQHDATFQAMPTIMEASDGIRAFASLMMQVMGGDPAVLLIDEPEAFLHPTLAAKLGVRVATESAFAHKNVIVATHSADFLMGCVQSGAGVSIVRITHDDSGGNTARNLSPEELLPLMREPLLRSTNVLRAIFATSVVVTEADADRAVYNEVNSRLVEAGRGTRDALFLNAQNWQTVHHIVDPLRKLGIPAAAIFDLDVLASESGSDWSRILKAAAMPEPVRGQVARMRNDVSRTMRGLGAHKPYKELGLAALPDETRALADELLRILEGYGLFFVRAGELERWFADMDGLSRRKGAFVPEVFARLGSDPQHPDYVRPGVGDVWDFIDSLTGWLLNPTRKGIPA